MSGARRVPGDCLKCHRRVHTIVETGRAPYVEHVGPSCEEFDVAAVEIVDGPPADAKQIGDGEDRAVLAGDGINLAEFGLAIEDVDLNE